MSQASETRGRVEWVDAARGLGIALVYLGHYLQSVAPNHAAATDEFRFLYSFHVPFFFLVSGFVTRFERTLGTQLRVLAARLLVPVAFFGVGMGGLDLLLALRHGAARLPELVRAADGYLVGQPGFDWVTWFLVCLFTCRLLAFFAIRVAKGPGQDCLLGLVLMAVGAYLGDHSQDPADGFSYYVDRFWFLSEAVTALGFFLVGRAIWPSLSKPVAKTQAAAAGLACLLVVFLTYDRNVAGGAPVVVMMAARQHGQVLWFMLTALSGSFAMVALGMLLGRSALLARLGRNSLPLLGLNGLFFNYANPLLARTTYVPGTHGGVFLAGLLVTALSLALCAPLVFLLNRFVPQLIGKPGVDGPWLPPLIRLVPPRSG